MPRFDIFKMGWMYEFILFMLSGVFFVDLVSIIKSLRAGREDIKEYAELCVKYLKIILCAFAGVFFLDVAFNYGYDSTTSAIHLALGIMMLLDAAVCLYLKIRYTLIKRR